MEREDRYIVVKKDDMAKYLTEDEAALVHHFLGKVAKHRAIHGRGNPKFVCVSEDWPEYETVWQLIASRVEGTPTNDCPWKTLESMPADTHVLFAAEFDGPMDWRVKMGEYSTEKQDFTLFGGSWTPTMWMPVPPNPKRSLWS